MGLSGPLQWYRKSALESGMGGGRANPEAGSVSIGKLCPINKCLLQQSALSTRGSAGKLVPNRRADKRRHGRFLGG
jgi:hypothetical protein